MEKHITHYDGLKMHTNLLPGLHTIQISEDRFFDMRKIFKTSSRTPIVYTFHDQDLNILYVGKTSNFRQRWAAHRKAKDLSNVRMVIVYTHETMADASFNESQAIVRCMPPWNIHGKNEEYSRNKIAHLDQFIFSYAPFIGK